MRDGYLLTVDQSTSGTKAFLIDSRGEIVEKRSISHMQIYPQSGWVEHDPLELYHNVKEVINEIIQVKQVKQSDVRAMTITNQRETVLIWDKLTGEPVYHAIVWQCRRTSSLCASYKEQGFEAMVHSKTGLTIDPYFSATKIKWVLDHVPGVRERAGKGELKVGTIDSWLLWKLTNGDVHATDVTNASRTLLYNIHTCEWDDELLELFGIPASMLPEVRSSDAHYGEVASEDFLLTGFPISGVIGDSQSALFAQKCFETGMAKATFGTGTSIMVYSGLPLEVEKGLVTSVAWGRNNQVEYALEGIIHTTGDVMRWMKDELTLFNDFKEAEMMAERLDDNGGVYLIPSFVGLGAPYWSPETRAGITGMGRNTNKAHIVRAGFESIAYQVKDVIQLINEETNREVNELRVDGGATSNRFLMQFIADMLDIKVIVSQIAELSALGSAYLGGLGVNVWSSVHMIKELNDDKAQIFTPSMNAETRNRYYSGWKEAIQALLV